MLGLVGCGGPRAAAERSGIFGTVSAGPTCPVEMVGSPCPPRIWTGNVEATDANGHVFRTATDDQGNYAITLAPGSYQVLAVTGDGPPFGEPTPVVVSTAATQRVDLSVDTGIR